MHVIMGYTRGDELIQSEAKALFAAPSREECEKKLAWIKQDRDEWLATHYVPSWAESSVFARFEIVQTKF